MLLLLLWLSARPTQNMNYLVVRFQRIRLACWSVSTIWYEFEIGFLFCWFFVRGGLTGRWNGWMG